PGAGRERRLSHSARPSWNRRPALPQCLRRRSTCRPPQWRPSLGRPVRPAEDEWCSSVPPYTPVVHVLANDTTGHDHRAGFLTRKEDPKELLAAYSESSIVTRSLNAYIAQCKSGVVRIRVVALTFSAPSYTLSARVCCRQKPRARVGQFSGDRT